MRKWALAALAAGTALRLGVVDVIKETGKAILDGGRKPLTWHRERMAADPLYPGHRPVGSFRVSGLLER